METNVGINSISKGSQVLAKVKNASIFLGLLYGIVFVLALPYYLAQGYQMTDTVTIVVYLVVIALVVHIATNGLYYLVVTVPLIMAVIFFVSGAFIWLIAPVNGIILGFVSDIMGIFGVGGMSDSLSYVIEFWTRVGQALMGVGTAMWWLVSKAKDINYKALYVYIIFLAFFSVMVGFIKPELGIIYLILWATLSLRVKEDNQGKDLQYIYKIAATLSIIVISYKTYVISQNAWYGESKGLIIYAIVIFLLGTYGVWRPSFIRNRIPRSIQEKSEDFLVFINYNGLKRIFKKFVYVKNTTQV